MKRLAGGRGAIDWRWGLLAAAVLAILSLVPQIHFWIIRGSQWQGAYVTVHADELFYSAYINSLIDGRPRRNDPFAGRDDHVNAPMPESLFSIQFIPPYTMALPARAFGASASTAFIALMGAAGFLAGLSIFVLLASVTGNSRAAAVGAILVLCLGTAAGGQGLLNALFKGDAHFYGLLFLRRFQPSSAFFLFFVFCALVWRAFTSENGRGALLRAAAAGAALCLLVFSYFYLWTAALAWFVCAALLWLLLRPAERRVVVLASILVGAIVSAAIAFYAYLLSHRSAALDETQLLVATHRPDLLRVPEIIGAVVLLALIVSWGRGRIRADQPAVIFAASFALLPFVLFNQQILTGRSLQPYHYEVFIGNYAVLVSLVMSAVLLRPAVHRRLSSWIVVLCLMWGAAEVMLPFQARSTGDVRRDEVVPVMLRLKELAKHDGTWDGLRSEGHAPTVVFSPQFEITGQLPTWAPQGVLFNFGSVSFQSISRAERIDSLYRHLYYFGKDANFLRDLLNNRAEDGALSYHARKEIFGSERMLPFLSDDFQPIRQDEIEKEVRTYETFAASLTREWVGQRPLTYVVTRVDSDFNFSHIDQWYARDAGEQVGDFTLYRVRLRE